MVGIWPKQGRTVCLAWDCKLLQFAIPAPQSAAELTAELYPEGMDEPEGEEEEEEEVDEEEEEEEDGEAAMAA